MPPLSLPLSVYIALVEKGLPFALETLDLAAEEKTSAVTHLAPAHFAG